MRHGSDSDLSSLFGRLRCRWNQAGIKPRSGESPDEVDRFESRYRVHLPPDLRSYFANVSGMEDGGMDADMFAFLPLQKVRSVPEELAFFQGVPDYSGIVDTLPDPKSWFVIVDFMISSAVFAVRLTSLGESSPVLWIGSGKDHRVVASTFAGFLETYLANPFDLF